ncbi:MAG TPA: glycosyltransferase family 4 protein [Acidobacteriota bacterium]
MGGIELYVYRLTEDLQKLGKNVEVISTDLETPLKGRRKEAQYFKTSFSFMRNPFSFELMKYLKENRYDLFHLHNIWFIPSFLAALYRKDAKIITTLHGVYPDLTRFKHRYFLRMYKPLAKFILNKSNKIIVLSDSERNKLVKIFKINPGKIMVIPNGIRLSSYKPANKENIVLFSGRIIPDKNPEVLIKAAGILNKTFSDFKLVFIGPTHEKYKEGLVRLVKACRLEEKTTFLDPLNQSIPAEKEKLINLYKKSYVFVSLGSWEGLPTRLMEAMQFEVPCVAYASGGSSELIRDNDNGLIIDRLDANLLADKLLLLFRDRKLAKRLGHKARLTIKHDFHWPKLSKKILDVYDSLSSR